MLINFNEQQERTSPGMNGGTGEISAKMFMDENGKIIPCRRLYWTAWSSYKR